MHSNDNQRNLGQRLRLEMKKRDLTAKALAELADVKSSFLYDVISGKSANPSSIKLARVAESLGVSLTYLAGTSDSPNEGYAFSLPAHIQDLVNIPFISVENGRLAMRESAKPDWQFSKEWLQKSLGTSAKDLRLFMVNGDNMQPTLRPGDIVMVNIHQNHPSPPGIFLLFDGHGLTPKRLELLPHLPEAKLRVMCDNSHYSAYETSERDAGIIGRIVWVSRKL